MTHPDYGCCFQKQEPKTNPGRRTFGLTTFVGFLWFFPVLICILWSKPKHDDFLSASRKTKIQKQKRSCFVFQCLGDFPNKQHTKTHRAFFGTLVLLEADNPKNLIVVWSRPRNIKHTLEKPKETNKGSETKRLTSQGCFFGVWFLRPFLEAAMVAWMVLD